MQLIGPRPLQRVWAMIGREIITLVFSFLQPLIFRMIILPFIRGMRGMEIFRNKFFRIC